MRRPQLPAESRRRELAPRASVLIESMRDIGYSLATAISDVIDNSITANARNIGLLADTTSAQPAIGVLDDGHGMFESELLEAMRPGSRNPLASRNSNDLGRFGLGLKTASFSQCRRLTVVTRREGRTVAAVWDLDVVAEVDAWVVDLPEEVSCLPWSDQLGASGTLVIWEKLDRLVSGGRDVSQAELNKELERAASHVELVFHRFLSGEPGQKKLVITLNGRLLIPLDPFHLNHPATQMSAEEKFAMNGCEMSIQAFTLPHHSKVSVDEWRRFGGPEGYIKNQGFYLYRQKRLIIHGTWFGMAQQHELTKLARVRIDLSNDMDAQWKIDVKKSSASPPSPVRAKLRRLIEQIGAGSKRAYTTRGSRLVTEDRLPLWLRVQDGNRIRYEFNGGHPALASFCDGLSVAQANDFRRLLRLLESAVPLDAISSDMSGNPEDMSTTAIAEEDFRMLVTGIYVQLRSAGRSVDDARKVMFSAEPFRSKKDAAEHILSEWGEDDLE